MSGATRPIVVGTAGHIDHGKSTLVLALTGIDPDRWAEEKRRGITIDLGFAHADIVGWPFSFVDVPGHERFVHNMLAGAAGIDLALMVVATDEGVMPQTREHLAICQLMGMQGGVVALTKIDSAEEGMADLAEDEIREVTDGTFLEGAEIVRVSGKTGEGLDALRHALVQAAGRLPPVEPGPWPRMAIDRVFPIRGFGTVVTGTLQGGALHAGEELRGIPGGPLARIRGLQVHDQGVDEAPPHRRVAINLQGVERSELRRGMMLVPRGREVVTVVMDVSLQVLDDSPVPVEQGMRLRVHHGTAEVLARVRLPGDVALAPGSCGAVQLRLEAPIAALPGDRFVVRRYSPVRTIGGGEIVDVAPPRWRKADPAWPARVERLTGATPAQRLADLAAYCGTEGLSLDEEAARLGTTPARARETLSGDLVVLGRDRVVTLETEQQLTDEIGRRLDRHHERHPLDAGVRLAELRGQVCPGWSSDAFEDLLGRIARRGVLVVERDLARRPGHDPNPEGADAEGLSRIVAYLDEAGFEVRQTAEVAAAVGMTERQVEDLLVSGARSGRVIRVKDGLWFSGAAWSRILGRLAEEYEAGRRSMDVPAFKSLFSLSRKHAIPLLERLDDGGVTRRAGNERRIQPGIVDGGPET